MNIFTAPFKKPTAEAMAKAELAEAQRELLIAQSAAEYATNLAAYHKARIDRLNEFLTNQPF